jgi:hypothetical protein
MESDLINVTWFKGLSSIVELKNQTLGFEEYNDIV